jgi:tRNA (cytidine/uridine-2'-O-)-methyltransferase
MPPARLRLALYEPDIAANTGAVLRLAACLGAALPAFRFAARDTLLLGRESAGVPDAVAESADARVRIPLVPPNRSLNVALAAALALGEALGQLESWPGEDA